MGSCVLAPKAKAQKTLFIWPGAGGEEGRERERARVREPAALRGGQARLPRLAASVRAGAAVALSGPVSWGRPFPAPGAPSAPGVGARDPAARRL